ncbi:hypothetical protein ABFS83_04G213300 [Erythranthe nasuta]
MPRQKLNIVDGKSGGRNCKVRKRGCSSSSSSSLAHNYRLKRAILVGKRVGSSTPVPRWKMMSSKSPSPENDKGFKNLAAKGGGGDRGKELSVSARKLAATLWEIDGLPSPRAKREEISELGYVRKERILEKSKLGSMALVLSDLLHSPVSERMDPPKVASHRRRVSAGSQKLLQADCFVEVDQMKTHVQSPHRHINGAKNRLKDVYNGLVTSKEVLKIMSRICRFEQENSTSLSLFSALKFELDRACVHVSKLIQENRTNRTEIELLTKKFEEEKIVWKLKEQDRIRSAINCIAGEMETERKLRRQSERLSKKLGKELAETKASLEAEKRAREILEQVCDELARGIGEDRAEVEEMKRQSEKAREEVEKEREMLQLADVIREERVQMKLSEAKYEFEEKNALVDHLRNELEEYLKSKRGNKEERVLDDDCSPSYDKIKELEKYLRETLPGPASGPYGEVVDDDVDDDEDDDDDEDEDDDDDSDLHSIELNMDATSKSFGWSDGVKKESKRNSVDRGSKVRKPVLEKVKKPNVSLSEVRLEGGVEWEFTTNNNKEDSLDVFDRRGVFEFESKPWKKESEDEIERYNMIKNLRDHIVSGSKMASTQQSVSSKDPKEVVCEG